MKLKDYLMLKQAFNTPPMPGPTQYVGNTSKSQTASTPKRTIKPILSRKPLSELSSKPLSKLLAKHSLIGLGAVGGCVSGYRTRSRHLPGMLSSSYDEYAARGTTPQQEEYNRKRKRDSLHRDTLSDKLYELGRKSIGMSNEEFEAYSKTKQYARDRRKWENAEKLRNYIDLNYSRYPLTPYEYQGK